MRRRRHGRHGLQDRHHVIAGHMALRDVGAAGQGADRLVRLLEGHVQAVAEVAADDQPGHPRLPLGVAVRRLAQRRPRGDEPGPQRRRQAILHRCLGLEGLAIEQEERQRLDRVGPHRRRQDQGVGALQPELRARRIPGLALGQARRDTKYEHLGVAVRDGPPRRPAGGRAVDHQRLHQIAFDVPALGRGRRLGGRGRGDGRERENGEGQDAQCHGDFPSTHPPWNRAYNADLAELAHAHPPPPHRSDQPHRRRRGGGAACQRGEGAGGKRPGRRRRAAGDPGGRRRPDPHPGLRRRRRPWARGAAGGHRAPRHLQAQSGRRGRLRPAAHLHPGLPG